MNIARILVTMKCEKHCDGCCNTYKSLMEKAIHIEDLMPLNGYDTFCITGGEPLLDWERTRRLIHEIQDRYQPKVYLYTAMWIEDMADVIRNVDGIHYTLHYPLTTTDYMGFLEFQKLIRENEDENTYRLYIDQRIEQLLIIQPNLWTRVEVKPWILEGNCPLPPNETLFILNEEYNG